MHSTGQMNIDIDQLRDGFDTLFLSTQITEKEQELFDALGMGDFVKIYMSSKKHGYAASQKVLTDLVKLSMTVYGSMDNLPLQKKVILPEQDGDYKFIVTSFLPETFASIMGGSDKQTIQETSNTIGLICTGDDAHAKIAEKCGIDKHILSHYVFGGGWIKIDNISKKLEVYADSGSFGSCSNQIVERLLQEYKDKGYTVSIDMVNQREFFK